MNRRAVRILVVVSILAGLTLGGALPTTAGDTPAVGGQVTAGAHARGQAFRPDLDEVFQAGAVLVRFHKGVTTDQVDSALRAYEATRVRFLYHSDVELWRVPEGRELEIVAGLNADPGVVYAEPNYVYSSFVDPDDPHLDKQWAHTVMQSAEGWELSTGSAGVTIAIIDTGVDETHPDLAGKLVPGYDIVKGDGDPHDTNGHGTHCAGIAAAATDNGVGIAGLNWNARIMPVRVLGRRGSGYVSDIVAGILWAHEHGADVISMSFGGPFFSQSIKDVVDVAYDGGTMLVAAMGNWRRYDNPKIYPAGLQKTMAVAATGPTDVDAPYSQYGAHCDIAAPGGDMDDYGDPDGIYSTMPTYPVYLTTDYSFSMNYDYLDGTSMATPYVAGLAALIRGADPSLTPAEVQAIIESTADDLGAPGWDEYFGWGRINVLAALQEVAPPSPTLFPIDNPDGEGDYLVDWNWPPGTMGFTLEEDDNPNFDSPTVRYDGSEHKFAVTGQATGVWYYRVRSIKGAINSPWSETESTTVVLAAPNLLPIDNPDGDGDYLVDWEDVPNATSYTLEEDDGPGFDSPTTRYTGANSQFAVSGQAPGRWYYRVRASNALGDGAWSEIRTAGVLPAAPVLSPIDNPGNEDQYDVEWSSVPGATSYLLQSAEDAGFMTATTAFAGPSLQYSVTGQPSGTWHYRVRAQNLAGAGPWSTPQQTTVGAAPLIGPSLLPIDNIDRDGDYVVSWTLVPSATGYMLEESRDPYFVGGTTVYSGTQSCVTLTGRMVDSWYYRVRAHCPLGKGPWSNRQSTVVGYRVYLPIVGRQTVFVSAVQAQRFR